MQRYVSCMALACALLVGAGSFHSTAYGFPPKGNKPAKAKARGRVPKYFGMLDLSDDQKTKIYDVQGKYKDQIDALEAQVKELRAKEGKEVQEILTAEQKTKLQELIDTDMKALAAKKAEKKAARAEKKADVPAEKKEEPKK